MAERKLKKLESAMIHWTTGARQLTGNERRIDARHLFALQFELYMAVQAIYEFLAEGDENPEIPKVADGGQE